MNEKIKQIVETAVLRALKPVLSVLIAMVIGVLLILPTGTSPLEAYGQLFGGAFGSFSAFCGTLEKATPLLFCGLSACIALKAGIFNIGIEGQLYMGAIASALVAAYADFLPDFLIIPASLLAAGAAGMAWAVIPAVLKDRYQINLIISSIMTNNMAILFTTYLSSYLFKGDLPLAATPKIPPSAVLPPLVSTCNLNAGFILAMVIAVILYVVMFQTPFGYELRAMGLSEGFTKYMGVPTRKMLYVIMMASAFIAGLGGAEQSLGVNKMFISGFSSGYGFTGITVVLLGGMHPVGTVIAAIFFGALTNGANRMEVMTSVPKDLISTIQAVIILLLAAEEFLKFTAKKRKEAGAS